MRPAMPCTFFLSRMPSMIRIYSRKSQIKGRWDWNYDMYRRLPSPRATRMVPYCSTKLSLSSLKNSSVSGSSWKSLMLVTLIWAAMFRIVKVSSKNFSWKASSEFRHRLQRASMAGSLSFLSASWFLKMERRHGTKSSRYSFILLVSAPARSDIMPQANLAHSSS